MSNGFMTIKDVAGYLKIKEQTVYRLVSFINSSASSPLSAAITSIFIF